MLLSIIITHLSITVKNAQTIFNIAKIAVVTMFHFVINAILVKFFKLTKENA